MELHEHINGKWIVRVDLNDEDRPGQILDCIKHDGADAFVLMESNVAGSFNIEMIDVTEYSFFPTREACQSYIDSTDKDGNPISEAAE